jgi:hypothetical protein
MNKELKPNMIARCTSVLCAGVRDTAYGVVKEGVRVGTLNCPDCSHVILWMKESSFKPKRKPVKRLRI